MDRISAYINAQEEHNRKMRFKKSSSRFSRSTGSTSGTVFCGSELSRPFGTQRVIVENPTLKRWAIFNGPSGTVLKSWRFCPGSLRLRELHTLKIAPDAKRGFRPCRLHVHSPSLQRCPIFLEFFAFSETLRPCWLLDEDRSAYRR
jgi:hypothetical protein